MDRTLAHYRYDTVNTLITTEIGPTETTLEDLRKQLSDIAKLLSKASEQLNPGEIATHTQYEVAHRYRTLSGKTRNHLLSQEGLEGKTSKDLGAAAVVFEEVAKTIPQNTHISSYNELEVVIQRMADFFDDDRSRAIYSKSQEGELKHTILQLEERCTVYLDSLGKKSLEEYVEEERAIYSGPIEQLESFGATLTRIEEIFNEIARKLAKNGKRSEGAVEVAKIIYPEIAESDTEWPTVVGVFEAVATSTIHYRNEYISLSGEDTELDSQSPAIPGTPATDFIRGIHRLINKKLAEAWCNHEENDPRALMTELYNECDSLLKLLGKRSLEDTTLELREKLATRKAEHQKAQEAAAEIMDEAVVSVLTNAAPQGIARAISSQQILGLQTEERASSVGLLDTTSED